MKQFNFSFRCWLLNGLLVDKAADCVNGYLAMFYTVYHLASLSVTLTSTALLLLLLLLCAIRLTKGQKASPVEERKSAAPGPKPWPIYGSLHLLAGDANPWEAFLRLRKSYGDVFQITLGRKVCVVVSSLDAIREVLTHKTASFNNRPNFMRYHALFGGDRDNSLALCDWSEVQKTRRKLAYPYVFPRHAHLQHLEHVISSELDGYVGHMTELCLANGGQTPFVKADFSSVCANVFYRYFCSKRYDYDNVHFQQMVKRFDDIFHDINNGFAVDFLPWLAPFKLLHLARLYRYGQFIRNFLVNTLIDERKRELTRGVTPDDFLDAILRRQRKDGVTLSNEEALYELEDLLGGHSAVSCFWSRVLAQIIYRPDIQRRIRAEMESVGGADGPVTLAHRSRMPFTQAVIWETLRVTTSPIVPHVAAWDTSIGGFHVKKDSIIFLNNYYLNLSDVYWKEPQHFDPNRFLNESGQLTKPGHFLPFGSGQRSCLGYQLVHAIVFLATVKVVRHFDLKSSCQRPTWTTEMSKDIDCAKLSVYDSEIKATFHIAN